MDIRSVQPWVRWMDHCILLGRLYSVRQIVNRYLICVTMCPVDELVNIIWQVIFGQVDCEWVLGW